jgi:hypothetical protein
MLSSQILASASEPTTTGTAHSIGVTISATYADLPSGAQPIELYAVFGFSAASRTPANISTKRSRLLPPAKLR